MTKKILSLAGVFLLFTSFIASPDASASSRSSKKIGIGVGFITEPAVSLLGYSLSYNLNNHFRLTGGYGTVSSSGTGFNIDVTTIGLNGKFFLLDWNFSPFVGAGISSISGTVTGTGSVGGLNVSGKGTLYSGLLGVDWQTGFGFTFGVEYDLLFGNGVQSGAGVPGAYLGWAF